MLGIFLYYGCAIDFTEVLQFCSFRYTRNAIQEVKDFSNLSLMSLVLFLLEKYNLVSLSINFYSFVKFHILTNFKNYLWIAIQVNTIIIAYACHMLFLFNFLIPNFYSKIILAKKFGLTFYNKKQRKSFNLSLVKKQIIYYLEVYHSIFFNLKNTVIWSRL